MSRFHKVAAVASGLLLVVTLAGCSAPLEKGSPEAAVQSLLQLRSELTTDPAKYASFVETPMAQALADDSASRSATATAPTPKWKTPENTSETSDTAKVTVRWKSDSDHPGWAKATVFVLERTDGHWLVVDADSVKPSGNTSTTP